MDNQGLSAAKSPYSRLAWRQATPGEQRSGGRLCTHTCTCPSTWACDMFFACTGMEDRQTHPGVCGQGFLPISSRISTKACPSPVQPACEFSKLSFHLSAHPSIHLGIRPPTQARTQPSPGYRPPTHLLMVLHDPSIILHSPSTHHPSAHPVHPTPTCTPNTHPTVHSSNSPFHLPTHLSTDYPFIHPPLHPSTYPFTQHSPYPFSTTSVSTTPRQGVRRHPRGVHRLPGQEGIHGLGGRE